ncbi:alpha/beta hydrolase [Cohnella yongneupensis]|uniref:Alpha/beta hydrolase n=1 Tax=Cohnella yongneupensis TaxID=425006 RepID=A0ABW0R3R5_9BACL
MIEATEVQVVLRRRQRPGQWLKQRLSGLFAYDTRRWRAAVAAMWLIDCAALAASALGMPTGFGTMFDVVAGVCLNTIALPLASWVGAALLALIGLRVPRFTIGSALYTGIVLYFVLYFTDFGIVGSSIYAAVFTLLSATIGILVDTAFRSRRSAIMIGGGAVLASLVLWTIGPFADSGDGRGMARGEVNALGSGMQDPSVPGGYAVDAFTYGSGEDLHRAEFGKEVGIKSEAADASPYIEDDDWIWLREKFWGFDQTRLPLNGRVWMPEGAGPFPLVLMVHGNHLMEDFSDEGYGYLGELLASRGIIAVSVDENFLNYSAWSGIPDQDMKLRAWLLLKHIGQLEQFNADASSRLYGRIDFRNVALLGHSRGGQAVAMAADRDEWFQAVEGLPGRTSYSVRAVVAIAPTDTSVDGKQARLSNISYLTLQGAKDADLVNFNGDGQYDRTNFDATSDAFKASLYIGGANHSQFNTTWGQFDNAYPGQLFIRPKDKLSAEEQRQIAKTYVSAFLENVFHDAVEYRPLFRDYRIGLNLLPESDYYSQYQEGGFRLITGFEGTDRAKPSQGVTAEAFDMKDWRNVEAQNREHASKADKGVLLAWNNAGTYSVKVPSFDYVLSENAELMFSIVDMSTSPMNGRIQVEVKDRNGVVVRLPLDRFADVLPPPKTDFTWLPGMESELSDGKFANASEYVYQTVEIPLSDFEDADPDFTPSEWAEMTLAFDGGPGSVMLDDLGIMP